MSVSAALLSALYEVGGCMFEHLLIGKKYIFFFKEYFNGFA
jgi:hypothetical protein